MAQLSPNQIAEITGAKLVCGAPNEVIARLLLDSRQYSSPIGVLFIALRGHNRDGEKYIPELIKKGVKNFLVHHLPEAPAGGVNYYKVTNTLSALQRLARHQRTLSHAEIIAITGSNGKTVVKEWLSRVLQNKFKICRSPKSYNSQIGVPLSVWELSEDDELGIFEAGISKPGEMDRLAEILKPDFGIFTNIGSAHGENFDTTQEKIDEKLKLFRNCKKLVFQNRGDFLSEEIRAFAHNNQIELCCWSANDQEAELLLLSQNSADGGLDLKLRYYDQDFSCFWPFKDEASLENVMQVIRMALELGLERGALVNRVAQLTPVEMRLQMKQGSRGNLIIDDAYNADLESLRIALHFLETQGRGRSKIVVLSDLLETGVAGEELYAKVSEIIGRFSVEKLIAIGPKLSLNRLQLKIPVEYFSTTEDFLRVLPRYQWNDKAILLKGARSFRFERLSHRMEQKSHQTCLNIYLNRMVNNLGYFRDKLDPSVKIMAMVKAFSYGSGSFEVANLLQFNGVDWLAVAYPDEGVDLRKAGIELPILVLNPESGALDDCIRHKLEPEIYSLSRLHEFAEAVRVSGEVAPYPIHIKLETGMNRLGFMEDELESLVTELKGLPELTVASAFSHMPAADDPHQKEFTLGQIKRFKQMSALLKNELGYDFMLHLSNSNGILNYPQAHFDMVRLGISLYGVSDNKEAKAHLQVVSELKAEVSQIKNLTEGDTVSYGRTYTATGDESIAIISIGYADGFRRSLSNGIGEVVIRGKRYPVVGRVCMDMIMVNITGGKVKEGDEVEIFGPNLSVYELAEKMDTIPYEVFTGISQRVKRVYFME